jgi:hypothetical protein
MSNTCTCNLAQPSYHVVQKRLLCYQEAVKANCDTDIYEPGEQASLLQLQGHQNSYMGFITMYAVSIAGVHEWNGFAQKVKSVSQRQGDFNNILTLSDEAFLVLCLVTYQAKWCTECNQHTSGEMVSTTA